MKDEMKQSVERAVKKAELLAPAGNYECFQAAIYAGADAVYLAGSQFGARAFADNFSQEELISAIAYAHLFDRKVYMTVNTLLKESEMQELVSYMIPYYEAGLDGVIIQDIGVFEVLKRHFPGMELHCSTQMTITGVEGALFAKELGAERIVPARELSLQEIREIRAAVPEMELECFIHGALCYCYSGQCLLSSMLGGRSGNRGTCAQPCRLPYDVSLQGEMQQKGRYPLSLKDLCTAEILPELIEAGIASFKIEGRMKRAEYCAGVTHVYRQLMDRYYADPEHYQGPTAKERKLLGELYIRSEVQEGYYHSQNGRQMITMDKPSYMGCDESGLAMLRERFCDKTLTLGMTMKARFQVGESAMLSCICGESELTVTGEIVQQADKKPMTDADIRKQLLKVGNTFFTIEDITIDVQGEVFYPVSRLNELRREALSGMMELLLAGTKRTYHEPADSAAKHGTVIDAEKKDEPDLCVSVMTMEQLTSVLSLPENTVRRIYADPYLLDELPKEICSEAEHGLWLRLPRIIRNKDAVSLKKICSKVLHEKRCEGIYVDSVDAYRFAVALTDNIIAGASIYQMNRESVRFWQNRAALLTVPYECNEKELYRLTEHGEGRFELPVYGRIPLMVTANCLVKSFGNAGCTHKSGVQELLDRKKQKFPVINQCRYCYNELYNSVPLSLHKHVGKLSKKEAIASFLLSFTIEDGRKTTEILHFYQKLLQKEAQNPPFTEYTNGHFQRGVD